MNDNRTVLIVDDEPELAKAVEAVLKEEGYQTITAPNGEEGLRLAKEIRPALVILDWIMPKLPGLEVCRAIREDQDKTFRHTPIIMLTAKTDDVDRVIGNVLGANHYLTKPFQPEVLLSRVKELTTISRQVS